MCVCVCVSVWMDVPMDGTMFTLETCAENQQNVLPSAAK